MEGPDNKEKQSGHIFMFPFKASCKDESSSNSNIGIKELKSALENWEKKEYKVTQDELNYSEFFYFHDYVRSALFNTENSNKISCYLERKHTGKCKENVMVIHVKDVDNKKTDKYKLPIEHVSMRLFDTGIGILTIELANYKYPDIEDVLKINDSGRRIYPQFLSTENGTKATKEVFLADKIDFEYQDISSREEFSTEKFFKEELETADYIKQLLGESFFKKYRAVPVIDDRMFTVCWYGNDTVVESMADRSKGYPAYKSSDDWYKMIFVDGKSIGCANEEMKTRLIKDATYERWTEYGTLYGISRYSFVCLTGRGYVPYNVIRNHMERQYYQLISILLAQRASILKFSDEVSSISGIINSFVSGGDPLQAKELEEIANKVRKLHASYINFVNRLWFTEVTPQEQGIEIYKIAMREMGLKEQMEELKAEIKELYEFVNTQCENEEKRTLSSLDKIVGFVAPVSVLSGLFGMNVLLERDLPCDFGGRFWFFMFFLLIAYVVWYYSLKKPKFVKKILLNISCKK